MSTIPQEVLQERVISASTAEPIRNLPAVTPAQMLQMAVAQGADLDRLTQLMDLNDRWEKTQARKAYITAMAAFKQSAPTILKDKHVKFQTSKGITEYDHATLFGVCAAVIKGLAHVGISHRWIPQQSEGMIKVTCELTHIDGHCESISLHGPYDDSGGKNAIQSIVSAKTYLERHTLLAATGLATKDQDDDGGSAGAGPALITDKQAADLEALISEVGADKTKFLAYLKADNLRSIPATRYSAAVAALESKRR